VGTFVAFHAHPDDEAIATGGTMLLSSEAGHRVILVVATRGECGEVPEGVLGSGETLGQRREVETRAAATFLGVDRVEFLGYRDSGMVDEPTNDDPLCFWQADVEEAANRLATILVEESADVVSLYDSHGGYGHPDHIQVHRVGHRAAEIAGTKRVYEATMNRDAIAELRKRMEEFSDEIPDVPEVSETEDFGSPGELITTAVDVSSVIGAKRDAMASHASQITKESFFLAMPETAFQLAFGTEWYIRTDEVGASTGTDKEPWIFAEPHPVSP
jgi:LmbE family N-acetylglucosaminyl deacetylase